MQRSVYIPLIFIFTFILNCSSTKRYDSTSMLSADPQAKPYKPDGFVNFMNVVEVNFNKAKAEKFNPFDPKYKEGNKLFVNIVDILPGQNQIAYLNVFTKLNAIGGYADVDSDGKLVKLTKNNGKSLFPKDEPRKVALHESGLILLDGHHSVFTCLYLPGCTTLPVTVVEDLGVETEDGKKFPPLKEAYTYLKNQRLVYLTDVNLEEDKIPVNLLALKDDPMRYFTAITSMKGKLKEGKMDFKEPVGTKYPLWVKVGMDMPFAEFFIAEELKRKGFKIDDEELRNSLEDNRVEEARRKLSDYMEKECLNMLTKKEHWKKLPERKWPEYNERVNLSEFVGKNCNTN